MEENQQFETTTNLYSIEHLLDYLWMRYEQNKPKANTDTPGIPVHDAICVCDSSRTEDRISGIVGISIYIAAAMKNVEVVSFQKSVCIWRCFS